MKSIKTFVEKQKTYLKYAAEKLDCSPTLSIIQVGNVEASNRYVRNKMNDCREVGIIPRLIRLSEDITPYDFIETVKAEAKDTTVSGIIVQLPVPAGLNSAVEKLGNIIPSYKDVDGMFPESLHYPCTPLGIMMYLYYNGFKPEGKHVVVIGRSKIVGKPMADMLLRANSTVTVCHSKTRNLYDIVKSADLVVCAVGKANFLDCSKIDCPVIDVGINFVDGKLVGDCFNTEGKEVTPVPGGVGLLTRVALCSNVVAAQAQIENMI